MGVRGLQNAVQTSRWGGGGKEEGEDKEWWVGGTRGWKGENDMLHCMHTAQTKRKRRKASKQSLNSKQRRNI